MMANKDVKRLGELIQVIGFNATSLTIREGYTGGKAFTGVPNTVLPLMKAFMMKLVTVLKQEHALEKAKRQKLNNRRRKQTNLTFPGQTSTQIMIQVERIWNTDREKGKIYSVNNLTNH